MVCGGGRRRKVRWALMWATAPFIRCATRTRCAAKVNKTCGAVLRICGSVGVTAIRALQVPGHAVCRQPRIKIQLSTRITAVVYGSC
ncbi:hypothetical protein DFH06DRAFT_1230148 [Mycena polygramma]|nr:hypothetical protein DFH06DRAFT_1230148 [Mycena polygramma]